MHSDITEGLVSKGGVGIRPKGVRPPPPKGQCTQPTDVQQLKDKIAALESRLRMVGCESPEDTELLCSIREEMRQLSAV